MAHQCPEVSDPVQAKADPVQAKTDPVQAKTNPAQAKTNPAQAKTDPVTDPVIIVKLTKKQQDIRNFCSVPRSRQEILNRAGVTDHFDNRKKYIYDLIEAGVLERTIPEKLNAPNQKYRRRK